MLLGLAIKHKNRLKIKTLEMKNMTPDVLVKIFEALFKLFCVGLCCYAVLGAFFITGFFLTGFQLKDLLEFETFIIALEMVIGLTCCIWYTWELIYGYHPKGQIKKLRAIFLLTGVNMYLIGKYILPIWKVDYYESLFDLNIPLVILYIGFCPIGLLLNRIIQKEWLEDSINEF